MGKWKESVADGWRVQYPRLAPKVAGACDNLGLRLGGCFFREHLANI